MQTSSTEIASWENYTKGFGSKILKKSGWKEGQSVGKNSHGLIKPLICDGNGHFDGNQVNVIKKSKSYIDEKKIHLIKELDKLLLDSDDEDDGKVEPKNTSPAIFKPLKPYRLGSSSGPIVWC